MQTHVTELHVFSVIDGGNGDLTLGHEMVVVDVVTQHGGGCTQAYQLLDIFRYNHHDVNDSIRYVLAVSYTLNYVVRSKIIK